MLPMGLPPVVLVSRRAVVLVNRQTAAYSRPAAHRRWQSERSSTWRAISWPGAANATTCGAKRDLPPKGQGSRPSRPGLGQSVGRFA